MFSFLCYGFPVCYEWNIEEHVSVENQATWAAAKRVVCTPALMACIAIERALSIKSLALDMSLGGCPCSNMHSTFPTI